MAKKPLWCVLSLIAWMVATEASTVELGKMAPADLTRIKARTICSCVFVQRMSLQQCSDGRTAIWRYTSPETLPSLLVKPEERLEISRDPGAGMVRLLAQGGRVLAESRFLPDGGGCITGGLERSPSEGVSLTSTDPDSEAMSVPLPRMEATPGIDKARVGAILAEGFATNGPLHGVARAAVVTIDGKVVADQYAPGFGRHNLFYVGSIAKVFNNLLAGLLVRDGLLHVSDHAELPQWRVANDGHGAITFDHLLKMVSGISWDENFWVPGAPAYEVYFGGTGGLDIVRFVSSRGMEAEPGTHFEYSTGSASLLAAALQTRIVPAGRASLLRYFQDGLFAPLGMRQTVPEFDPQGVLLSGHAVFVGAEDLARVGNLLLNDGVAAGRRVLPQGWMAYSREPALAAAPAYGAQLQLDMKVGPGCFGHAGVGENRLVVCPAQRLVIVWLSSAFDFTGTVKFDSSTQYVRQIVRELSGQGKSPR